MTHHLDPDVERYLMDVIVTKLPFKLWEDWAFGPYYREQIKSQLPRGARPRDYPHVYLSMNRPVSFTWARELDPESVVIATSKNGDRSYVASRELLSPEIVYRLELHPLLNTRANTLLSLLDEEDVPLIMAKQSKDDRIMLAMMSPDTIEPSKWRTTYFEEGVGPTGHLTVESPRDALRAMLDHDYAHIVAASVLDEIASTFPEGMS